MNETLPDVSAIEQDFEKFKKLNAKFLEETGQAAKNYDEDVQDFERQIAEGHNYVFIGKVGQFCPMMDGFGGGVLLRQTENKKTGEIGYAAVTGTKGFRWMESEMVNQLDKQSGIDRSYYDAMVDAAIHDISQYGDFEWFVSDDPYVKVEDDTPPWETPGEPWSDGGDAFAKR